MSVLLDGDESMLAFLEPTDDQVCMVACLYLCDSMFVMKDAIIHIESQRKI